MNALALNVNKPSRPFSHCYTKTVASMATQISINQYRILFRKIEDCLNEENELWLIMKLLQKKNLKQLKIVHDNIFENRCYEIKKSQDLIDRIDFAGFKVAESKSDLVTVAKIHKKLMLKLMRVNSNISHYIMERKE